MKVVLLAAGLGTRLRPITNTVPKCLVPILDRPLLGHWMTLLQQLSGLSEVYVNCHYLSHQVKEFIAGIETFPCPITLLAEEELLGTAGTLCHPKINIQNEQTIVIHADNLSMFNISEFLLSHDNRPKQCAMTMMLFETDTPQSCGIVDLDSENVVCQMHEKVSSPPGNLANGAVYIFEPEVVQLIQHEKLQDISLHVIPKYLGAIYGWLNQGYHRDIGTMESYGKAQKDYPVFLQCYAKAKTSK